MAPTVWVFRRFKNQVKPEHTADGRCPPERTREVMGGVGYSCLDSLLLGRDEKLSTLMLGTKSG
jgi:hypothetical protein